MAIDKAILNQQPITAAENILITKNAFSEHGNEIQDIISGKLPFIVRWGTVLFLFLLVILSSICWFIKYPDLVLAPARLTSINAPKQIISLVNGKLIKLSVKEGEEVQQGKVFGFIESTASHDDVLRLDTTIKITQQLLKDNLYENLPKALNDSYSQSQLGELQQPYQVLSQAFLNYKNYLSNGFYLKKKSMLSKDIDNLQKLKYNLENQKKLQELDLSLSQKTFEANESLKRDKVVSELDFRTEESKLINKKLAIPQIDAALINNESQINDKEKEIGELQNTINQQKIIFQQALNTFRSQLDDWKKKYLLIAPLSGKVSFVNFIQENQQLQVGQTICFINPENSEYFAQIFIPQTNFGKIAVGQIVHLKLNSYPFQEYGYVKGKIDFIVDVPTDSGYLAKVTFINGLNTTYNKQVQYRDGLTANAEIITKDLRLLERFYYDFIKQVKR